MIEAKKKKERKTGKHRFVWNMVFLHVIQSKPIPTPGSHILN